MRQIPEGKSSAVLHRISRDDVVGATMEARNYLQDHQKISTWITAEKRQYNKYMFQVAEARKSNNNRLIAENLSLAKQSNQMIADANVVETRLRNSYDRAVETQDFLIKNYGRKAITRLSSNKLRNYATAMFDRAGAEWRQQYNTPVTQQQRAKNDKLTASMDKVRRQDLQY
ncbi:hypothetical protein D3C86_1542690 [compost metagenome]